MPGGRGLGYTVAKYAPSGWHLGQALRREQTGLFVYSKLFDLGYFSWMSFRTPLAISGLAMQPKGCRHQTFITRLQVDVTRSPLATVAKFSAGFS